MTKSGWRKVTGETIASARRIAVLGVGNPDKGDDGAGMAAAAALAGRLSPAQKRRVRVLLGGSAPENLTGKIRAFRPELVVILDAVLGGLEPGSIFRVAPEMISDDGVTTHQISLRWLIRYIEESIGCPVIILGMQPKDIDYKGILSVEAETAISNAVEFLLESLPPSGKRPGRR